MKEIRVRTVAHDVKRGEREGEERRFGVDLAACAQDGELARRRRVGVSRVEVAAVGVELGGDEGCAGEGEDGGSSGRGRCLRYVFVGEHVEVYCVPEL